MEHGGRRPARTVLEQRIRELNQTQEEFAEYATTYAREHRTDGTLSTRQVQRLVSGSGSSTPRPATARLLEGIFGQPIGELLGPPGGRSHPGQALRVAIALVRNGSEVLMVRARSADGEGWRFPAGIVKPGGTPAVTAVREVAAETGVRCVVVSELGSRLHPQTDVYCSYLLCDYVTGEARNLDPDENTDVAWIPARRVTAVVPESSIYPPVLAALDHDRQRFTPNGNGQGSPGSTVRTTGDGEERHA